MAHLRQTNYESREDVAANPKMGVLLEGVLLALEKAQKAKTPEAKKKQLQAAISFILKRGTAYAGLPEKDELQNAEEEEATKKKELLLNQLLFHLGTAKDNTDAKVQAVKIKELIQFIQVKGKEYGVPQPEDAATAELGPQSDEEMLLETHPNDMLLALDLVQRGKTTEEQQKGLNALLKLAETLATDYNLKMPKLQPVDAAEVEQSVASAVDALLEQVEVEYKKVSTQFEAQIASSLLNPETVLKDGKPTKTAEAMLGKVQDFLKTTADETALQTRIKEEYAGLPQLIQLLWKVQAAPSVEAATNLDMPKVSMKKVPQFMKEAYTRAMKEKPQTSPQPKEEEPVAEEPTPEKTDGAITEDSAMDLL